MSKIPSDDVSESLYKLRIRESDQLKTVLELYDMEILQKLSVPNYRTWKTMVNEGQIRNSGYENLPSDMRKSRQGQWSTIERD